LDRAIEFYIAGDYDEAVERLDKLLKNTESEEQLREIYLYLGRSYVELEQYSQAIDAFTVGAAYGGGLIFEAYLTRLGVVVSVAPEILAASDKVTRAQLAALIDKMFFGGVKDIGAPSDDGRQEAVAGPSTSVQRGVVPTLPDGGFHGNNFVTRAAFYVVVARLIEDTGIPGGPTGIFEGGFTWALNRGSGATDYGRIVYISGREALDTLQRLAEARRTNG
jgi:tetratricopeptide (TPR) repeat protein